MALWVFSPRASLRTDAELIKDNVHDNQFGFRKGRNTSLCGAMLNDILAYFLDGQSPVFSSFALLMLKNALT